MPTISTSGLKKSTVDPSKIEILIPAPEFEREQRERDADVPDFGAPNPPKGDAAK